jgi:hypothetical protein|tara:strand:+ start:318 stop:668 length:351 start_codon:yes stop_codon:yes gene_type:complete
MADTYPTKQDYTKETLRNDGGSEGDKNRRRSSREMSERMYTAEMRSGPLGQKFHEFTDRIGDGMRSVGEKLLKTRPELRNRITSQDDEEQMKVRKEIKGYKRGGEMKKRKSKKGSR